MSKLISSFLTFLPMLIIINNLKSSLASTYFDHKCSNTTMFTNNSQYQTNLNTLFMYLRTNTTNRYGYHNATAGVGTNDVVYGSFLCRGDQNSSSCHDCVTTATITDLPITYCPNRKVAIMWYDECMVRYSNESFFGIFAGYGFIQSNPQNVTGNVLEFTDVKDDMLINIANQASRGGSEIKYATGGVVVSSSVTVYGLAQCTPDISSSDCKRCLTDIIGEFPICMGARLLRPSCSVRFETYQFFNGNVDVMGTGLVTVPPSLPPLPPPTSNATRTGMTAGPGTAIVSPTSGNSKTSTNKVIAIVVGLALLQLDYLQ